jgi:hypothetical protein
MTLLPGSRRERKLVTVTSYIEAFKRLPRPVEIRIHDDAWVGRMSHLGDIRLLPFISSGD